MLRYAQLIKENAEQIHWLESILMGKAKSFIAMEIDIGVEALTCTCQ